MKKQKRSFKYLDTFYYSISSGGEHSFKENELRNINPDYDILLLDKATFITGYAQFDYQFH